ncbi:hypothetical protein [Streptomyces sp. NPDC050704]|uniref:hypothetical protein n=1 Tax=Streptomyces sp. NPDC050704 TaxID=3157219 RepID=UPI00341C4CBF
MTDCRVNAWTLGRLPQLNRAILAGQAPPESLVEAIREEAFPHLAVDPGSYGPREAERITTLLGMWGSACVRHYVQHRRVPATDTRALFAQLGIRDDSFRGYLGRVAERTGAGHPDRDTYVSYFHWNPPAVHVRWAGRTWTARGAFGDGRVRTHTGDLREVELLLFVKKAEAVERAANELLEPLTVQELATEEAVERMTAAAGLLNVVHRLFADFTRLPIDRRVTPEFFTDTWRQYTNHWEPGDFPPSGAADVEFIARDFLLGIDVPDYPSYVRRLYPALVTDGQELLTRLMGRTPIPDQLLERVGITPADLARASAEELLRIAAKHPELAACYLLLAESTRLASAHLNFGRRFVFDLRRSRDEEGMPDTPVMSSRIGSTGIRESFMDELKRGRRGHRLTALERVRRPALAEIVAMPQAPAPADVVTIGT